MLPEDVDVYVALGDSFSSGEGAPSGTTTFWWEARNTDRRVAPVNLCHRSNVAYPPIVARALGFTTTPMSPTVPQPPDFEFVACSGAVINQLTAAHPTNSFEPAQLAAVRDPDRHTDLLTFTIGGNDMGFASIIEYCMLVLSCESDATFAPGMQRMIVGSRPILAATYQQIKAAASPDTHVAVLTYPQILPFTSCGDTGWWALTDAELTWMRQLWTTFNIRIAGAAADAGIHVVDVESAFTSHRICDPTPYAHGVYTEWRWDPTYNSMFSFHPNTLGHQILGAEVLASLQPPGALGVPRWTADLGDLLIARIAAVVDPGGTAASDPPVDPETELTTGDLTLVDGAIGGVVTAPDRRPLVVADGFAPGAMVTLQLGWRADPATAPADATEPVPVDLGTFAADGSGHLEVAPTLPAGAGAAVLVARGANPFGGIHLASADVWLLGACRALAGFSDVPASHPFCEPIDWMADAGITAGLPDGSFGTRVGLSRQGMAAFLYRLVGEPAFTPPVTPSFWDVPLSHPFFAEIEWLAASGITAGLPDGSFRPGQGLSRQGMAAFLYNLASGPLEPAVT